MSARSVADVGLQPPAAPIGADLGEREAGVARHHVGYAGRGRRAGHRPLPLRVGRALHRGRRDPERLPVRRPSSVSPGRPSTTSRRRAGTAGHRTTPRPPRAAVTPSRAPASTYAQTGAGSASRARSGSGRSSGRPSPPSLSGPRRRPGASCPGAAPARCRRSGRRRRAPARGR